MEPNDQVLVCVDCKKEFTFTSGEQQFFDQKACDDHGVGWNAALDNLERIFA